VRFCRGEGLKPGRKPTCGHTAFRLERSMAVTDCQSMLLIMEKVFERTGCRYQCERWPRLGFFVSADGRVEVALV